jgi:hypothetical protein
VFLTKAKRASKTFALVAVADQSINFLLLSYHFMANGLGAQLYESFKSVFLPLVAFGESLAALNFGFA